MKDYVICEAVMKPGQDGYRAVHSLTYVPAPEMAKALPFTEQDFRKGLKEFVNPEHMDEIISTFFGDK